MSKNKRQAYCVKKEAGHQHSAESWGTGRAVSRIPRVSGGGTSRAGQGAFGNMCRSGRMFAPTKTWRKWHRKINTNQKRFAVASALAASALPALVMARGHRVENVPEVPLVVNNSVESIEKTKAAIAVLVKIGAFADVQKVKESRKFRAGKGKLRDRRHVQRRGPLVVYAEDHGVVRAFRNLPGVELAQVDRLNLLQLAPGGHLGRFIIWTQSAFERLNAVYGSTRRESTQKIGYKLPFNLMANTDLNRLINSDEIQSKVNPAKRASQRARRKKNPLKNFGVKVKLNPYAMSVRRSELLARQRRAALKEANLEALRKGAPATRSIAAAKKVSAKKTHAPRKSLNYKKIVDEDFQEPKEKITYKTYAPAVQIGGKIASAEKKTAPKKGKKGKKGRK